METRFAGKAFVFGKNIDTDQIYPGRFVELTEVEDIKKYAMYGADEEFTKKFVAYCSRHKFRLWFQPRACRHNIEGCWGGSCNS